MKIKVWTSGAEAGLLGPLAPKGSAFAYGPNACSDRAVSLTMPVRLASWNAPFGLAPIFEMNLPEGVLREQLRLTFAKALGKFDDFDLLSIVGRSQIGRLRYTGVEDQLDEAVPFQSVDEILASRRDDGLFQHLLARFATYAGVSGVQPKLLLRDETAFLPKAVERVSIRGATHIVKFWDPAYPELAANEYFCLCAAARCGLDVPKTRLAQDGRALVVDRFDLRPDGRYLGFEDFCVLNARSTAEKYRGSYETSVLKRFQEFASPDAVTSGTERLFTLIVLNCALRNGDAHLKNFGVLYNDTEETISLAPVYDLVTTTAYLPQDMMALTLDGSTRWPDRKRLQAFGERRVASPAVIRCIMERVAQALAKTAQDVRAHMLQRPAFAPIGARMLEAWSTGAQASLGCVGLTL